MFTVPQPYVYSKGAHILSFLQISAALTNFADGFLQFYNSGQEHLAASKRIMKSMQELSSLTSNSKGSSISTMFSKVRA